VCDEDEREAMRLLHQFFVKLFDPKEPLIILDAGTATALGKFEKSPSVP
jgi:hypothetical protein